MNLVTQDAFQQDQWRRSQAGLYVPDHYKLPKRYPVAIDLFCGCGGFSLGFIKAGFQVIAAMDSDPWATITYCHNLGSYPMQFHFATPEDKERLEKALKREYRRVEKNVVEALESGAFDDDDQAAGELLTYELRAGGGWVRHYPDKPTVDHFFFGDIRQFSGWQILEAVGLDPGEVDAIMGGPPCQGFSKANVRRNVMDPRNSLVFDFARLVIDIQPKMMVMENVPEIARMVTPEGIGVIDAFCMMLSNGGYSTYDALKRSMESMISGARAAARDHKPVRSKVEAQEELQPSLF